MLKFFHNIRTKVSNLIIFKSVYLFICRLLPVHVSYELNRVMRSPYSPLEDANKIIFIHIPKAAGNAVIKSLYNKSATGHDPLIRYARYDKTKFESYFKFAVVRNPWDRMVSSYHYLQQGGIGFFDRDFAKKYLIDIPDFEAFVRKIKTDSKYRKSIMSWVHFTPQMNFLSLNAKDVGVDKVLKLESMDVEYQELCELLGKECDELIKDNSSVRSRYQDYYSPDTIEIVRQLYSKDIEMFGYEYGDSE